MKKPDLSQPQPQLPEYFGTAQEDGAKYLEAVVGFNPEVDDPRVVDPDERALVVSGRGLQHGRLRVLDKVTPRTPTLSLTRIKATLTADDPAPPPRRRPSQPGYNVSFSHFHPLSDNTTSSGLSWRDGSIYEIVGCFRGGLQGPQRRLFAGACGVEAESRSTRGVARGKRSCKFQPLFLQKMTSLTFPTLNLYFCNA